MGRTTEILIEKDVPAGMRDGTTLRSNVYRPTSGGPYPVLLTRLPYGKDQPRDPTYFDPLRAARRGYIVVVQDVRGRFASEGEFGTFPQEIEDGHDTVEWAAKLPGSDGTVGMWGLSYFGKTQWHAATTRPPSLRSMVPGQTWGNHLNGASLRGGAQELGLVHLWAQGAIALHQLFRQYADVPGKLDEKLPETVGIVDEILAGGGYDALPLSGLPDPDGLSRSLGLGRGVDEEIWDQVNVDGKYDRVDVPTFHIGGWYDCFVGETLRQYEAMNVSKAVLITGCSSGIGWATAERLVDVGWRVYATARNVEKIAPLEQRGCALLPLDVADEESMISAVDEVERREGAVGVLVNNAGYSQSGAVEAVPLEKVRRQFETNVFGLARMCQLVLPGMRRQGYGRIVNVSSMGGKLTFPGAGYYHATKHAVEALSDALRFEVRGFGVEVSVIEPGLIKTGFAKTAVGSMDGSDAENPYAGFDEAVARATAEIYERGPISRLGGGPEAVAEAIERAISARAPRSRYAVTPSAHLFMRFRRLLPDGVWDAVLKTTYPQPGR